MGQWVKRFSDLERGEGGVRRGGKRKEGKGETFWLT